jgi:non-homologous end joining protein Ku
MPRAPRKGFLRLSLVSCPIYLMRAATKTKSIRLHQVWMPRGERHTNPIIDGEDGQRRGVPPEQLNRHRA